LNDEFFFKVTAEVHMPFFAPSSTVWF